jgi:hypothetical protein
MHENIAFILHIYKSSHSAEQIFDIFNKYVVEILPQPPTLKKDDRPPVWDSYKINAHYTEECIIRHLFEDNNISTDRYHMIFVVEKDEIKEEEKELSQYDLLQSMSKDIKSFMNKFKYYNEKYNDNDLIEARKINDVKQILNSTFRDIMFYQKLIDDNEKRPPFSYLSPDYNPPHGCDMSIRYNINELTMKRKLLIDVLFNLFTLILKNKSSLSVIKNDFVTFV